MKSLTLALLGAAVGLIASCVGSDLVPCSEGLYCPATMACDRTHGVCVQPVQLTVCVPDDEGDSCSFPGAPLAVYRCQDQVCLPDPFCGDGAVDADRGEVCDCGSDAENLPAGCDGPNSNSLADRCRLDCQPARCGDGMLDAGEQCDDGNADGGDGCSAACQQEACGNGTVDEGEVCDDSNSVGGDGCSADCRSLEQCGNGIIDFIAGEACDCGTDVENLPPGCAAVNGDASSLCSGTCQARYCGNGEVDPGEVCDDGNHLSGDNCSGNCKSDETCGNGKTDLAVNEECDCGLDADDLPLGCSGINGSAESVCGAECTIRYCGDGVVDPGEECDDGNQVAEDACADVPGGYCRWNVCGDGFQRVGTEECDDGNNSDLDGCSADCVVERCGNGRVDVVGEECDCGSDATTLVSACGHPNGHPSSPCASNCTEPGCGNGVMDPGEVCDDGNLVFGDDCSGDCLSDESCGNGIADFAAGEECDCGVDSSAVPLGCLGVNGSVDGTCLADCTVPYESVLFENFQGGTPPADWTLSRTSTESTWTSCGGSACVLGVAGGGNFDEVLFSDEIVDDCNAVSFKLAGVLMSFPRVHDLAVWLVTGAWQDGDDLELSNGVLTHISGFETDEWLDASFAIPPQYNGVPFRLAFVFYGYGLYSGQSLKLDEVYLNCR